MSKRSFAASPSQSPSKRIKSIPFVRSSAIPRSDSLEEATLDWPAPAAAMEAARHLIMDIVAQKRSVLIAPDKDADGLTAGSILYRTLVALGLPRERISVHHLAKGCNVHAESERKRMAAHGSDCLFVLDQGSRPGPPILPGATTLIIDHHMSTQWPEGARVLTACQSRPIATTSLLTYLLLRPLIPMVRQTEDWRAVVGVYGDLGPSAAKWGTGPWPSELGLTVKRYGSKALSDAVSAINSPRRTADYNVPKAWEIMLNARDPREITANAFLRLCKIDVAEETAKWARTAPKFSTDGRVAVIRITSGFQIHPVIATRWAGTLGKRSQKLVMIMCANNGYSPDGRVSFSCRLSSPLRMLPDGERPNLIQLLKEFGDKIPGFNGRVGGDFARGHEEATGGIIASGEFQLLLEAMGVPINQTKVSPQKRSGHESANGNRSITEFFKT